MPPDRSSSSEFGRFHGAMRRILSAKPEQIAKAKARGRKHPAKRGRKSK